ncbi:MAG TPA: hypothetical protein DDW50_02540 [Firmicutes bacterium]|jgi:hypothetical protein|nr:hypothetical protein [Bacillota bacterium]
MQNPYLMLSTLFMCLITFFICYQLALAFIGVNLSLKKFLLPTLIISLIAYVSKIILSLSAPVHTVVIVVTCAGILYLFNRINVILSLIGSLLTFTTLTLGSMLLACPFFLRLGYIIPVKFNGMNWLFLCLLELIVPTLVLVILKTTKFSLMKYIPSTK